MKPIYSIILMALLALVALSACQPDHGPIVKIYAAKLEREHNWAMTQMFNPGGLGEDYFKGYIMALEIIGESASPPVKLSYETPVVK